MVPDQPVVYLPAYYSSHHLSSLWWAEGDYVVYWLRHIHSKYCKDGFPKKKKSQPVQYILHAFRIRTPQNYIGDRSLNAVIGSCRKKS